jgi:2'-5' RNA ligase
MNTHETSVCLLVALSVFSWLHNQCMRLFTALDPTPEVHDALKQFLDRLRPAARLRWSRPEGLHLTLKFIGQWPDARLAELRQALSGVTFAPFDIGFSGLGFFPNPRSPRVFWAGIQAGPELGKLAALVDRTLEPLGVEAEKRPYSPHLTLARIEGGARLEALQQAIQDLPSVEFGSFRADRFYLYESRPAAGGSIYTRVGEFPGTLDVERSTV